MLADHRRRFLVEALRNRDRWVLLVPAQRWVINVILRFLQIMVQTSRHDGEVVMLALIVLKLHKGNPIRPVGSPHQWCGNLYRRGGPTPLTMAAACHLRRVNIHGICLGLVVVQVISAELPATPGLAGPW